MGDSVYNDTENMALLIACTLLLCVAAHYFFYNVYLMLTRGPIKDKPKNITAPAVEPTEDAEHVDRRPSAKTKKRTVWKGKSDFSHPWLLKSLKGHPGTVLHMDFSPNGKFLAATCEDGSMLLWDIRDLSQNEHRTLRVNVEFDHASHVMWSPDSKAFAVHTVQSNCIMVYKIEKKKDGTIGAATPVITFDKVHKSDVVGFGIASNGKYLMSCSSDTGMVIWDLKGQQLENLDTYVMTAYSAKISPCGRFVVATGFSPDVKVMEVCFKTGTYKQIAKAFELTGHTSGVFDVAFDVDTSHIVTISKDGTWRFYHVPELYGDAARAPHLRASGSFTQCARAPCIALSPNAEVLAVSVENSVEFYETANGHSIYDTVENIFTGPINFMAFDASGKYLFACGDRSVRILHNVCGYQTSITNCLDSLKSNKTSATIERLQNRIAECQTALAKFGK